MAPAASADIYGSGGVGVNWTGANVSPGFVTFTATNLGSTTVTACSSQFSSVRGAGDTVVRFRPTFTNCNTDISGISCATTATVVASDWWATQGPGTTSPWTAHLSTGASSVTFALSDPGCGFFPADCTLKFGTSSGNPGGSYTRVLPSVRLGGTFTAVKWSTSTVNCGLGTGSFTNGTIALPAGGVTFSATGGLNIS